MYKSIKVIHIMGVVMFFGSILGHAIAGIVSSVSENPQVLNTVREVIQTETYFLTIPGLVLFVLTGIAMLFAGKLPLKTHRWLIVHLSLGALVGLNALLFLVPVGQEILEATQNAIRGGGTKEHLHQLENREAIFGAINIFACVILVTIAVIKPKFGGR